MKLWDLPVYLEICAREIQSPTSTCVYKSYVTPSSSFLSKEGVQGDGLSLKTFETSCDVIQPGLKQLSIMKKFFKNN
jgi:hypothetical protein